MSKIIELNNYRKGDNKRINRIFHDAVWSIKDYKLEHDNIEKYVLDSLDFLECYIYDLELKTKNRTWKTESLENTFIEYYDFFKESFGKDELGNILINHLIYFSDLYFPILNEDKYYIELIISGIIGNGKHLKLSDKNKVKNILKDVTNPIIKDKFNVKDDFDLAKINDIIDGLVNGLNPLLISTLYSEEYPEYDLEEDILTLSRIKEYYLSEELLRFQCDLDFNKDFGSSFIIHDRNEGILKNIPYINSFSKKYKRIYLDIARSIISKHDIDAEINDIVRLTSLYLEMGKQIEEFDIEEIKHYIDLGGKRENRGL